MTVGGGESLSIDKRLIILFTVAPFVKAGRSAGICELCTTSTDFEYFDDMFLSVVGIVSKSSLLKNSLPFVNFEAFVGSLSK